MLTEEMENDKPVVLVDGSSYLFRAFHALPPLTASDGHPSGAIKGVTAMLRKLMADYPGSRIAVVFDASGKTFRNELYAEYKANRPPMPDDLRAQVQPVKEIIEAMGLPLLVVAGVEADDVIGTLAREAEDKGTPVVISTNDKDMAQLVGDHVTLVNTMSDTEMDAAGVEEKFGIAPERITDYLALVGDSVDNIPGVPKVGPKTAAKWLQQFGDLDEVIAHADEIKGKVGENLRASTDFLPLSRELATIRCDVELPLNVAAIDLSPPDDQKLLEIFRRFEFKAWVQELSQDDDDAARADADYELLLTEDEFEGWIEKLAAAPAFAFDTETTSGDYMDGALVGVSFAMESAHAAYVPLDHRYTGVPDQLSLEHVIGRLRSLLESEVPLKIGHDLKRDKNVLARHGVDLQGIGYDTMLESYVLDSVATRHGVDDLALKYLGRDTIHLEDIAGKGKKQLSFDQVPIEQSAQYAAEVADVTLQLHYTLWPRIESEPGLKRVFAEIEMPLLPVLSRMERNGTLVDGGVLKQQGAELSVRIATLQAEAWELAGEEFNLDSTKQLQEIFYDKLELPILRKTPGGKPSTAEPVLQELALDYPLPRIILEYRSLAKLKSTYTDKLPLQINARTGRIHTSYHQAVAATGRLSSSDPNLQNIPIRTAEGRRIRQAFVAPSGSSLVAADYSQIELRIMAHLSGDEGLRSAFEQGLDVHRATAAEVFGTTIEAVSDEQRRSAKAINFGLIYGMSAFGLSRQLGVSRGIAQEYIERYFERYPRVREYMDAIRERARSQGYVETLFGRRLYLPEIHAAKMARRQAAERTAINAPMQGSAADIIKRAMIDVDAWLRSAGLDARMIMQVHDELVFEVCDDACEELIAEVTSRMQAAAQLSVPLVVDVGVGANWDQAH
ncbi:MAG: DNA polymerase I [Gammaproteobacteria bacterium]|nr:DNA polymerase I [Gammaproteobacteria bacterium]